MFPENVKSEALSIAKQQGKLANSPLEKDLSGRISLCAASCLAFAGLKLKFGNDYANSFFDKVSAHYDKKMVEQSFEELGWTRAVCARVMIGNDSTASKDRIEWFESYLA